MDSGGVSPEGTVMTEAELAEYFQQHLGSEHLYVQATLADRHLTVILNRAADLELDYAAMKQTVISHVKKLRLKQLESINIAGRIWGEFDPEWQVNLKIKPKGKSQRKPQSKSSSSAAPFAKSKAKPKLDRQLGSIETAAAEFGATAKTNMQFGSAASATPTSPPAASRPAEPSKAPEAEAIATESTRQNHPEFNLIAPDIDHPHDHNDAAAPSLVNSDDEPPTEIMPPEAIQATSANRLTVSDRQTAPASAPPQSDSGASNSIKAGDMSEFCFSRNKHLVKTDLANPDLDVADAVAFFHNLTEADKLILAPVLTEFFADPQKAEVSHLLPEWQEWLHKLRKMGNREFRSTSVWLSRYCLDRDRTMKQVNATLGFKPEPADSEEADRPDQLDQTDATVDISLGSFRTANAIAQPKPQPNNAAMSEVGMAYQKQVLTDIKFKPRSLPTTDLAAVKSSTSRTSKSNQPSRSNRSSQNRSRNNSTSASDKIDLMMIAGLLWRWRIVVGMLIFIFIIVPFRYPAGSDPVTAPQIVNNDAIARITPLHSAAGTGNLEEVQNLLTAGVNVNAADIFGNTPLHWAVSGCFAYEYVDDFYYPQCNVQAAHTRIAVLLINGGANPNATNNEQETPLHWAAGFGGNETVAVLLNKGVDVNAKNMYDETPLDYAYGAEDEVKAKLISDRGGVSTF
jgi:hypothetical protein